MKKFLLLCSLALCASFAIAEEHTSDMIVISDLTLAPGGEEASFTVSLQGSQFYTAYNMDIHFPDGVEINYYEGEPDVYPVKDIWPYSEDRRTHEKTYYHSLDFSYNVVGKNWLRIACSSNTNALFTSENGELLEIYVKASPYMKPGTAHITIDGIALAKTDGVTTTKYVPDNVDKEITISSTSNLTFTVSAANQWSTCVLPFDAALPDGVSAYTCDAAGDDALVLTRAESLAAYTPYIIYAPEGYSSTINGEVNPSNYVEVATSGLLSGALVPQTINTGFVMQNKGEGPMFYAVNGQTFAIPAGRCWMNESASLNALRYSFDFESQTGIQAAPSDFLSAPAYTLDGKRAATLQPGETYIKGGVKIIVK